jgi:4-hydroxybenzoyl-CoA thioesterase
MKTFSRTVRIEWGDCDPASIVYFPRYFTFFDDCTAAMFEAVGLPKQQLIRDFDLIGFAVVDVRGHFHAPSTFGEEVQIHSWVAKWGSSSFDVQHRAMKGDALAVEGFETRVLVGRHPADANRMKARPIPPEVIERFA